MRTSPVACDAVKDMGRLAAAEPSPIWHVAEIGRFPMQGSQDEPMLAKRWRKHVRLPEVRACGKLQDVVAHRVGAMNGAATVHRLTAAISVGDHGT